MTEQTRLSEQHQWLWIVPAAPVVWTAHFLLCYFTAAIWCAKVAGAEGGLGPVRIAIAAYTAVAVLAIAGVGWIGYRDHRSGSGEPPHDEDSPADRRRFLGFATLLLSGLSGIATIYTALVALFFSTCE